MDFFIKDRKGKISQSLLSLLVEDRVAINEIVKTELLIGAKDTLQYQELQDDLAVLPHVLLTDAVWDTTRQLGFSLARKGFLLPLSDLVIAASAVIYGCELFHIDRHFEIIARHASLKLYK